MVLLGLSILIASVSFLCYRHPPTSWACFQWLRPSIESGAKKQNGASLPPPIHPEKISIDSIDPVAKSSIPETALKLPIITKADPPTNTDNAKADSDRKAMPPPPPPFKKQLPLRNPQAPVPTFTVGNDSINSDGQEEDEEPSAPSFPAMNSAQRASGGVAGPPRLNVYPQSSPGLIAPPSRSPLPNRGPPGGSSSLAPPPTHTSIPAKPRRKVLLTPGHSPLDWARLSSSPTANLRGLPADTPYIRVPPSLLKQYTGRKGKDAWTVLGGKVYNITPYVPYHPGGGPELLKAAGRDGTKLFGEVHPWVNWEGMLEPCLVGIAVEDGDRRAESTLDEMD
ncbi:hypothetical protein ONS95_006188 [Cadophora gregata]|uniref:uncharacterized protein n=1 Tax=Cadophora gregata TaxID=51156 RepID=UPI0026DBAFFC|nr:uncharacterized protein ONS95_006188 [Cadophora gregata]KAK0102577.1 hypothetical protein ONS95_006188 [Cadophora gregata]KAK0104230.1 hypothetical protein ONS96_005323 [Cadophora gregata f. sp. sojae]